MQTQLVHLIQNYVLLCEACFSETFLMLYRYKFLSARKPTELKILIQEPNFALPEEDMKEFDQRSY